MALLATALMCTAMGAGCGGPPAVPADSPASHFAISYERSGGLAGTAQRLAIRPGRRAIMSTRDRRTAYPKTFRFRVGVRRVEGLRRALARAEFATIESPAPGPAVCADCFLYAIRYRGHEVDFDESDVPDGLAGVLRQIEAILAAH
jgi:hypothetical protein